MRFNTAFPLMICIRLVGYGTIEPETDSTGFN